MGTTLGSIDHAWLRMERPFNPMMITGVLTFDEPLDFDRLRSVIEERIEPLRRFRQRVRERRVGRAVWEDDPRFDVRRHLERRVLLAPADRAALQREIGRLVSTPLPRDRPLWALHLLESAVDGRTVLVARLHHALADGFALLHVMFSLTDGAPERGAGTSGPPLPRATARDARAVLSDLTRLATLPNQPRSILRGRLGTVKRAAWSHAIPLAEVKAIARARGGTVNDVLMAATAGAFARYLRERGDAPFDLRAAIPVNLRSEESMRRLGNYFGLVFLDLPLAIEDPSLRFEELRRRMDRLKRSPEPIVLLALMRIAGRGPRWLEEIVVRVLGQKTTAVLTNVPGPREPRYLAGRRIHTVMFWVPQSGNVGIGVSIFSYAGEVRLGLAADARLVPDPERVLEAFEDELRALRT